MTPPTFYSCTIQGQVFDQNNNPRGGLDIEWDPKNTGSFKKVAETDLSGNFRTKIQPIPRDSGPQAIRAKDKVEYPTVGPGATVTVNFIVSD